MNSMKKNRTDVKAKKKNKKKKVIIVLILIILIVVGVFAYTTLNKGNDKIEEKEKVVDSIKDFDYTISDTDTKLFKTKFNELKKELKKSTIDNKKYSKLVAELFIIDFFTLDNKITNKEYSVYKRSKEIKNLIKTKKKLEFTELFNVFNKEYVIVTFLSVLDLTRKQEIEIRQERNFDKIFLIDRGI